MGIGKWVQRVLPLRRVFPLSGVALVILSLVLLWWGDFRRPYIGSDFSYSADIVVASSLYDQVQQRYGNSAQSKGRIFYQLNGIQGTDARLHQVLSLAEDKSGATLKITRDRDASTTTGRYLPNASDPSSSEYVLAPAQLHAGRTYNFRYAPYNASATMYYLDHESLLGLTVFHYTASYPEQVRMDENDIALPGVPAGQGVAFQPNLEVWVEPTTGWLIKLEDNGLLLRYDRASGQVLGPYAHYSVRYTGQSIEQQVAYARSLKEKHAFDHTIAPLLAGAIIVLTIGFFMATHWYKQRRRQARGRA
ncbi:MAG TPA: porin PorA family protein [Candidatus Saccharimonadales bacterium]|nr:porin PorA family protein [Candidatus Saccharimonadales bacterium]